MVSRKDDSSGGQDAGNKPQATDKPDDRKARGEHMAAPTEVAAPQAEERQAAEAGPRPADRGLNKPSDMNKLSDMANRQEEQGKVLLTASTLAYRELTDFSRADLDALLQSSARLAQGLQEVGWEMTNLTQQSMRLGMQLASNLMECRTMEDMVGVHRDFVKETVDTMLAESARILSVSSRVASEAVTPLGERASQIATESQRGAFSGRMASGDGHEMRH